MSYTGRFRRAVTTNTFKKLKGNIGPSVGPDDKDEIMVKGDPDDPIITSGNSNTHTLEIQVKDAAIAQRGVVALATQAETNAGTNSDKAVVPSTLKTKLGAQTDKGIPYGDGDGNPIKWSDAMTDGEVMIGSTSGDPQPAKITSSDGSLSVVSGSNSIDLKTGAKIPTEIVCEQNTATPSSNRINLFGDDLIDTVAQGNTINVNTKGSVVNQFQTGGSANASPTNHTLVFRDTAFTYCSQVRGGIAVNVKQMVASKLEADDGSEATARAHKLKLKGGTGCSTKVTGTNNDEVTIDVTAEGGGLKLTFSTSQTTNMQTNKGYVSDYESSSTAQFKLPTTAAKGDMISVTRGLSSTVRITQSDGDTITVGSNSTTNGTSGYIEFLDPGTSIVLYLHSTTSTTKNWRVYSGFFANVKVV